MKSSTGRGSKSKGDSASSPANTADDGLTQSERFIKAAQELGTDDDPERFKERVRKLAMPRSDAEASRNISSDSDQ